MNKLILILTVALLGMASIAKADRNLPCPWMSGFYVNESGKYFEIITEGNKEEGCKKITLHDIEQGFDWVFNPDGLPTTFPKGFLKKHLGENMQKIVADLKFVTALNKEPYSTNVALRIHIIADYKMSYPSEHDTQKVTSLGLRGVARLSLTQKKAYGWEAGVGNYVDVLEPAQRINLDFEELTLNNIEAANIDHKPSFIQGANFALNALKYLIKADLKKVDELPKEVANKFYQGLRKPKAATKQVNSDQVERRYIKN